MNSKALNTTSLLSFKKRTYINKNENKEIATSVFMRFVIACYMRVSTKQKK